MSYLPMFILVFSLIFVNCKLIVGDQVENDYNSDVKTLLDRLNSQPFKVYDYKDASLLNAHKKGDVTEITIEVNVYCTNKYPNLPCSENQLICNAFVGHANGIEILGDVNCEPKITTTERFLSDFEGEATIPYGPETDTSVVPESTPSVFLSNEAASSESGEPFLAIQRDTVPCLGCFIQLNKNIDGIQELVDIGLKHIESENTRKYIGTALNVYRQIVSGVKYILIAHVIPTDCEKDEINAELCSPDSQFEWSICRIVYLQKPWSSKTKHIISNNCTRSQAFTLESEISNEIDANYHKINDKQRLADLESQILVATDQPKIAPSASSFDYETQATEDVPRYVNTESMVVRPSRQPEYWTSNGERSYFDGFPTEFNYFTSNYDEQRQKRATEETVVSSTEKAKKKLQETVIFKNGLENSSSEENVEILSSTEETVVSSTGKAIKKLQETVKNLQETVILKNGLENSSSEENVENSSSSKENNERRQRSVGHWEKISHHEKSLVRDLADFAAATLDNIDDDNQKRIVLQILGAKKMPTDNAGVTYQMVLRLGITQCLEDKPVNEECRGKLLQNYTKNCRIQVHLHGTNAKLLKSTCQNTKPDNSDVNRTNYSRYKRQLIGGETKFDKNHPKIEKFLKESLIHYNLNSNETNKYKTIEIGSVTTEVVSGKLYRINAKLSATDCLKTDEKVVENCHLVSGKPEKLCQIKVWEQPWLHKRQTTIKCDNKEKYKFEMYETRKKRNVNNFLGGELRQSNNDTKVVNFLKAGLSYLDSKSSDIFKYKVYETLSATRQVVAGHLWKIKALIVLSDCSKNDITDPEDCGILTGQVPKICNFTVLDQPWLTDGRQTNVTCENEDLHSFRSRRDIKEPLLGSEKEQSKDKAEAYLNQGLEHLDSISSHSNKYKVKEVLKVTHQVVGGSLWRIKAEIAVSDCGKNDAKDRSQCGILTGTAKICDFKIYDRPWLTNGRQTNITCENEDVHSFRSRRDIKQPLVGYEKEQSKDNVEVLEYLAKGLAQLDSKSGYNTKYKVTEVVSVTHQIVAGSLWRIKAKIALSNCGKNDEKVGSECEILTGTQSKICDFKIHDQPWLSRGLQTNITCENEVHTFNSETDGNYSLELAYSLFENFVAEYNKEYESESELTRRFNIFRKNLAIIKEFNDNEQGTATYGITRFADLTQNEFSVSHGLKYSASAGDSNEIPWPVDRTPDVPLPKEFDWRKKNVVSSVKDQGQCGSCWAFSVTGNVEGQYALKHGKLLEFSEQELVDCDKIDEGCNGGLMDTAYRVIEQMGGLETEQDYPYDAEDEKCHFNRSLVRAELSGAVNISHNETDMMKWLVKKGPISIAINANAMQFYMGGVSHPLKFLCSPNNLDHGVLIVGYGVHKYPLFKKKLPYWIVKNSWGRSWGEQGYYRVYRGDGTCGLNQTPSSAIVE